MFTILNSSGIPSGTGFDKKDRNEVMSQNRRVMCEYEVPISNGEHVRLLKGVFHSRCVFYKNSVLFCLFAILLVFVTAACSDKKKKKTTPRPASGKVDKDKGETLPDGSEAPTKDEEGKEVASRPDESGDEKGGADGSGGGSSGKEPLTREGSVVERDDKETADGKPRPSPRPAEDPMVVKERNLKKGREALKKGKSDQAIESAKAVLAVDEKNTEAMVLIAKAYMRKNKLELARAVLGFLASVDSDNAEGFYLAAQLALKDGELKRARTFFEKAVEKKPKLGDAWSKLCTWYVEGKNWKETDAKKKGKDGLTACTKAVELRSWSHKDRLNLGNVYRGLGNECRSAGMRRCEEQRAKCISRQGESGGCEDSFQNCRKNLAKSCKSVEATYYKKAKDAYLRANELYQEALRKSGKSASPYPLALYNLGVLYLDAPVFPGETGMSRLKKAKAYLNQYLQAADPRTVRKERKTVQELIQRADNLFLVEKAKEEAKKSQ